MLPESGWRDQKLPFPGLSGVRATFTKQSLKERECLKERKQRKDGEKSAEEKKHSSFILRKK